MFDKNGYYNTNKIKSYNARFYIVASERGLGKTYGEKKALFRNFTRRGYKFACIYRTAADLFQSKDSWLDPLTNPAPLDKSPPVDPTKFKWRTLGGSGLGGVNLEFEGETIGYFRCIAAANMVKYETFPEEISEVFFDEFAPVVWKKLPGVDNEGEALRIIIDTMDHDTYHPKEKLGYPPIRTLMFCNPRNRTSPLYDYFQIPALKFGVHRVNRDVVCEQIEPVLGNTEGGLDDNPRKCVAWLETSSFIRKPPRGSVPTVSVRVIDHYYTILQSPKSPRPRDNFTVIRRSRSHPNGCRSYIGTLEHLSDKEICIDHRTKSGTYLDWLKRRITCGADFFESIETKYSYIQDVLNL